MKLLVNGRERILASLEATASLSRVLQHLELRADRVAVELNGELAPRTSWAETQVRSGDRLEVVHFVGGGSPASSSARRQASRIRAVV